MYINVKPVATGGKTGDYVKRKQEERVVNSLAQATVHIIGPAKGTDLTLKATLTNTGFQNVRSYMRSEYTQASECDRDRMNVFFIKSTPETIGDDSKLISTIRSDRDINKALSPIIVVSEKTTRELISAFVSVGADHVLLIPTSAALIRERVIASVLQPPTFYRTLTYFGPDRRNTPLAAAIPGQARRGGASTPWSEVKIRRDPAAGCEIVHEQRGDRPMQKTA